MQEKSSASGFLRQTWLVSKALRHVPRQPPLQGCSRVRPAAAVEVEEEGVVVVVEEEGVVVVAVVVAAAVAAVVVRHRHTATHRRITPCQRGRHKAEAVRPTTAAAWGQTPPACRRQGPRGEGEVVWMTRSNAFARSRLRCARLDLRPRTRDASSCAAQGPKRKAAAFLAGLMMIGAHCAVAAW
jgi:hypothetical protein